MTEGRRVPSVLFVCLAAVRPIRDEMEWRVRGLPADLLQMPASA